MDFNDSGPSGINSVFDCRNSDRNSVLENISNEKKSERESFSKDSDGEILLETKKNASAHDIQSIKEKNRENLLRKIDVTEELSPSDQWRLKMDGFASIKRLENT